MFPLFTNGGLKYEIYVSPDTYVIELLLYCEYIGDLKFMHNISTHKLTSGRKSAIFGRSIIALDFNQSQRVLDWTL